jgi:hypothetical protein
MIAHPEPPSNSENPEHRLPWTSPTAAQPQREKEILVDLGLWAINHDQWSMASAVDCLVQSRWMAHE